MIDKIEISIREQNFAITDRATTKWKFANIRFLLVGDRQVALPCINSRLFGRRSHTIFYMVRDYILVARLSSH